MAFTVYHRITRDFAAIFRRFFGEKLLVVFLLAAFDKDVANFLFAVPGHIDPLDYGVDQRHDFLGLCCL